MAWTESARRRILNSSWWATLDRTLTSALAHLPANPLQKAHLTPLILAALALLALGWTVHHVTASKTAARLAAGETLDLMAQTTVARLTASRPAALSTLSANETAVADWLRRALPLDFSADNRSTILTAQNGAISAAITDLPLKPGEDLFTTINPKDLAPVKDGSARIFRIDIEDAGPHLVALRVVPGHGLLALLQDEHTSLTAWRSNMVFTIAFLLLMSLLLVPLALPRNWLAPLAALGFAADEASSETETEADEAAHSRLLDAIETISEAFVLWNAEKELVISNAKFKNFHRLPDQVVEPGTPYCEVLAAAKDASMSQGLLSPKHESSSACTYEAKLANGRWLQINERRTKDGGYVSVGTDITAVKRSQRRLAHREQELRASISDLRQSRRTHERQAQQLVELAEKYMREKTRAEDANRAKSEFLANISHELRTPLNAVIGFSEVMQHGLFGPIGNKKYEEYARDIHESGKYLLEVINDILDMSKIEAGRMTLAADPVNLGEIIEECLRIVDQAAKGRRIKLRRAGLEELTLTGDKRALKQVLINLLSNAMKFTPRNGQVTVKLSRYRGQARISIVDTGIGIPKKDIAKLGRPFEQVENQFTKSHKGSGLGLAISRSLVELHNGELQIKSKEGTGTTVTCRIPLKAAEEQLDLLAPPQAKEHTGKQKEEAVSEAA